MFINIRGASGSGKSTVVRKVMEHFGIESEFRLQKMMLDINNPENNKKISRKLPPISAYGLQGTPTRVLGRYETDCGGCDTIATQQEIEDRAEFYAQHGDYHVIFEGLLLSTIFDRWLKFAKRNEDLGCRFIYLTTTPEECVEAVRARREASGNTRKFDPQLTIDKCRGIQRQIEKFKTLAPEVRVYEFSRDEAFKEIVKWLTV